MTHPNREGTPTGRPSREHVLSAHDLQGPAADHAGEVRHARDADRNHRGQRAGVVDRAEHDRQQQRGEGEQQIVAPHQQLPQTPCSHRCENTERHTDHGCDAYRH